MLKKRVNLFGLEINDIPLSHALGLARTSLFSDERRIFFTPNLEMLEKARKSKEIKEMLNQASVLLPDGEGILLTSRLLGRSVRNKVTGIDFGEELIAMAEREKKSVFLLGGRTGVAKKAAQKLLEWHPNLKICGIHDGYYKSDDEQEVVCKIRAANPDILIVCMGFPRQERFVVAHKDDFESIKVITCLGGALDIWSGNKLRAPIPIRKARLEWLWRTAIEPKRIKRVLGSVPVLFQSLGIRAKKIMRASRIKRHTVAYNLTDRNS